jgi:excisionase family DNA binding protein
MSDPNNFSNTHKEIFNFNEACKYLDLSKSYLYKLTHLRKIPHYKPNGKKIYFLVVDCDKYLLKNRVLTQSELQQQAEEKLNQLRGTK